jgi:hypothetical protein
MRGAPDPNPLDVLGTAEVILVLRFPEPAALSCCLASRPANTLWAILLTPAVAYIDRENLAAAQTLGLFLVRHGSLAWDSIFADHRRASSERCASSPARRKTSRIKRFK